MSRDSLWRRLRRRRTGSTSWREPPPCVGCRGKRVDQLDPVEVGEIEPSTLESTIGPNRRAQAAIVEDQLVLLDPSSGHRVLLNASAALVYTAFDHRRRLGDVVEQLTHETGMGVDEITSDVVATVDRLLAQGLLSRGDVAATSQQSEHVSAGTSFENDDDPTVGATWSFDSGVRAAAKTAIVVRVEPAGLAADVEAALGALAPIDPAAVEGAVVRIEVVAGTADPDTTGPASDGTTARIVVDGHVRGSHVQQPNAAAQVFDQIDAVLAERADGLRFHAGAVERDSEVVLVLGQSGHGKSTLTAALVQGGWGYLTDELVVVDADTFAVAPYARPLDLDRGSLDQLGIDAPDIATGARKDKVFPSRIGRVSAGGCVAAIIVLTGEAPEDGNLATDFPAPEAVMALLALTFAATFDDPGALEDLARLCTTARTVRMYRGTPSEMVRAVDDLFTADDDALRAH